MSQQINLYSDAFRKREQHFSASAMARALGVVALGLCVLYAYALMQTRAAERSAAESTQRVAAQRAQLTSLVARLAPQARSGGLQAEVERLDSEVRSRQALLASLGTGALGNTEGFSEYLAAFGRQVPTGVWLTAITIGEAGNELHIEGRVLRPELLPAYLRELNDEAVMRGRRVTEMKLSARSAPPPAPARDGTQKIQPSQEPARYVAFSLDAPRVLVEPAPAKPLAPAQKGAAK